MIVFTRLHLRAIRPGIVAQYRTAATTTPAKKSNPFNIDYDPVQQRIIYPSELVLNHQRYSTDSWTNVTPHILERLGLNLHRQKNHPLYHLSNRLRQYFHQFYDAGRLSPKFSIVDNLSPLVTTEQNFDSICTPADHVSRTKSMNYYINEKTLLRAHTSAHQVDLMRAGLNAFLCIGDVYRRDSIDPTHYPIFHQCEGVRLFNKEELFIDNRNVRGEKDQLKIFAPNGKTSAGERWRELIARSRASRFEQAGGTYLGSREISRSLVEKDDHWSVPSPLSQCRQVELALDRRDVSFHSSFVGVRDRDRREMVRVTRVWDHRTSRSGKQWSESRLHWLGVWFGLGTHCDDHVRHSGHSSLLEPRFRFPLSIRLRGFLAPGALQTDQCLSSMHQRSVDVDGRENHRSRRFLRSSANSGRRFSRTSSAGRSVLPREETTAFSNLSDCLSFDGPNIDQEWNQHDSERHRELLSKTVRRANTLVEGGWAFFFSQLIIHP